MKKTFFILTLLVLSACSQFEPFEDMRREAGQIPTVGQSSNNRPAICYNPIWHTEEDIENLAKKACARTNRKPVFDSKSYFSCRFVNPAVAFYRCK